MSRGTAAATTTTTAAGFFQFKNKRVRKKSITIEPIVIPAAELIKLKALLNSPKADIYKKYKAKQIVGSSLCIICNEIPKFTVSYHANKTTVIERYCESCLKKQRFVI